MTLVDSLIDEYGGNLFNIAGIEDSRRREHLRRSRRAQPRYLVRGQDYLFNLAGQTSHLDSMLDPYSDLEINCRSQLSILEACRHQNPRSASSSRARARSTAARSGFRSTRSTRFDPVDVNGINKTAGEWYHLLYGDVYGIARHRPSADEHVRAADAGEGRAADVPRLLVALLVAGDEIRGLRRRPAAARLQLRRRRRRARSCSPPHATRRSGRSTTSATRIGESRGARRAARRAQPGGRAGGCPVPARSQGDRHRRLLGRLRQDRARSRVVTGRALRTASSRRSTTTASTARATTGTSGS